LADNGGEIAHDDTVEGIVALAVFVLGDKQKADLWLHRPSPALGNELPIKLLETDAGRQRVEHELRKIQFAFVY